MFKVMFVLFALSAPLQDSSSGSGESVLISFENNDNELTVPECYYHFDLYEKCNCYTSLLTYEEFLDLVTPDDCAVYYDYGNYDTFLCLCKKGSLL
tara:strand:+ start:174 stop:461 length:288 start_codon:yes stop_codon:yes gene_type:complete